MTIHIGDALTILRTLPADSVQCCVTSPPYWGLRDYGTATWEGGDEGCEHVQPKETLGGMNGKQPTNAGSCITQYREICGKCGARRIDAQLGLEPTPAEYVANMVAVFREVRRVLREDGTAFVNLGDSYAANRSYQVPDSKHINVGNARGMKADTIGLKPKDLCGIPWRVAFALQSDGWYLRQDIIWHKPNPMPESVRDRCTKAHEYIFLLSKSERYFWDAEAVKERADTGWNGSIFDGDRDLAVRPTTGRQPRFGGNKYGDNDDPKHATKSGNEYAPNGFRNVRSVWTITTKPFKEAHFATFPPEIPERCIKAGSKPGDMILDPFTGSGTTGMVAVKLGRQFVGCELNPEYAEMARRRIASETSKHALFAGGQA